MAAEISPTTGVGVDKQIDKINWELSQVDWIDKCYGRIWTVFQPTSRLIQKLPYTMDGGDPITFLKDDSKRAFSGIYLGTETITQYIPNYPDEWERKRQCGIIIGLRLDAIFKEIDVPLFQEILRQDVELALSKVDTFQLQEYIDDNTEAIFKGFDIRDLSAQTTSYPFFWMRLNGNLLYRNSDC